jgi:hypothetical protein
MTLAVHFDTPRPTAADCRIGQPRQIDFRQLLGRVAWFQLPEAVRRRFDLGAHDQTRFYPGTTSV